MILYTFIESKTVITYTNKEKFERFVREYSNLTRIIILDYN